MEITVNGLSLHYEQYGQGEDVLLLHGWGSSFDAFSFLGSRIAKKYKVKLVINYGKGGHVEDFCFAYQQAKTKYVTLCHQDDFLYNSRSLQGNSI